MVAIELIDWTEDVVFDLDRGRERKGGGKAVDRLFSCEVDMIGGWRAEAVSYIVRLVYVVDFLWP